MNPQLINRAKAEVTILLTNHPDLVEDDTLRADMIEAETSFDQIIRSLFLEAEQAAAFAKGITETVRELQERKERLLNRGERLRAAIVQLLQTAGLSSFRIPEATVGVAWSRATVHITDERELPEEYFRIKTIKEPNKTKIGEAMAEGYTVPGVSIKNGHPYCVFRK